MDIGNHRVYVGRELHDAAMSGFLSVEIYRYVAPCVRHVWIRCIDCSDYSSLAVHSRCIYPFIYNRKIPLLIRSICSFHALRNEDPLKKQHSPSSSSCVYDPPWMGGDVRCMVQGADFQIFFSSCQR